MSPKAVSTSVRGIGVAVITSMSGALPLAVIARRWWTPKRCCSSTIASTRSWKTTASWNSACVPMTMSIAPEAMPVEYLGALAALFAAGQDRRAAGRPARRAARWSQNAGGRGFRSAPSAPIGRRLRRRAPWRAGRPRSCRSRRRPAAGAACARARARSAWISASACSCEPVSRIGQRGTDLRLDRAVAGQRAAGQPPDVRAHQRQRDLPGQQLVIGEPPPGRALDGDIDRIGRVVEPRQRLGEGRKGLRRGSPRRPAIPAVRAAAPAPGRWRGAALWPRGPAVSG